MYELSLFCKKCNNEWSADHDPTLPVKCWKCGAPAYIDEIVELQEEE